MSRTDTHRTTVFVCLGNAPFIFAPYHSQYFQNTGRGTCTCTEGVHKCASVVRSVKQHTLSTNAPRQMWATKATAIHKTLGNGSRPRCWRASLSPAPSILPYKSTLTCVKVTHKKLEGFKQRQKRKYRRKGLALILCTTCFV